jgi:CelD/BcsL family acetyltransferase involved in cellulose biosynthesis
VLFDHGPALVTAFAGSMAQVGRLRACVIRCGNDIVAGSINVTHGKAIWAWLTAFDARYQRASPGIMLMNEYTRCAFNDGFEEIDYLRGDEAFKFEFATTQVGLSCFIAATTLPGMAVLAALRVRAKLQRRWAPDATGQIPAIGSAYVTTNGTPRVAPHRAKPRDHAPLV